MEWSSMSTRNLMQEAHQTLAGRTNPSPEAELASALLDRLDEMQRKLVEAICMRGEPDDIIDYID